MDDIFEPDSIFEPLPMTEAEMKAFIAFRMVSNKHWVFLPGLVGMQAVLDIERQFYPGSDEAEFKAIVVPFEKVGIYGIAFALKDRLGADRLAAFIRTQPLDAMHMDGRPLTSVDFMQHNVIILANPEEGQVLLTNFKNWIDDACQDEARKRLNRGWSN